MNNKTRSPIQFKRMLSLLMTFFVLALSISGVSGISGFSTQHPQRAMDSMLMEHPSMMQTATYLRCVV